MAILERKLNPSTFVFWQGGELYKNPPLFTQMMADTKGKLASREPSSFEDVDIWVLLLDGFDDIRNVESAPHLGIDIEDIANSNPEVTRSLLQASIHVRLHPIPIIVKRQHVALLNAKFLRENYKADCLDEMIYGSMIGHHDQELWDRYRISETATKKNTPAEVTSLDQHQLEELHDAPRLRKSTI
ncbi:hypothetical protein GCM10007094_32710 [Pseudovibrio japonicus]|uniref:Uncharacterized protein n=1 Tax=Pseudovibrio japonicus TaxID=366534 RepID=A0ABQ3EI71_9HYPH|nr:hypothetical protein GCM10007094_32710 [Pseudovibrio japonicus]